MANKDTIQLNDFCYGNDSKLLLLDLSTFQIELRPKYHNSRNFFLIYIIWARSRYIEKQEKNLEKYYQTKFEKN